MAELGSRAHPGAELSNLCVILFLEKGKSYDSAINSECYNDFAESLLPIG
jgi:hypothetical protein